MERWSGKVVVVTGASSGIGAALSLSLANHGLKVVGLARRAHLIDELATKVTGKGSITPRQCDISKPKEIEAAFKWIEEKLGGPDILVNNAGYLKPGTITELGNNVLSDEDIFSTIDVNLKGMVICTRLAISSMKKKNFNGHIVNVNSIGGHYVPFHSDFNIYSSTKHAVTAFTSALLNELADFKSQIKVTSISPGLTYTDMVTDYKDDFPVLKPEAVADAIVYTLSTPPEVNISELTIQPTSEKHL